MLLFVIILLLVPVALAETLIAKYSSTELADMGIFLARNRP